jgi:hypothetical protein
MWQLIDVPSVATTDREVGLAYLSASVRSHRSDVPERIKCETQVTRKRLGRAGPFPLCDKICRVHWKSVWPLLILPWPRSFRTCRCLMLRAFDAKVGETGHPYPSAGIWRPGT